MLLRFSVQNFLSFKDQMEFSMMAGRVKRHKNHTILCQDKKVLKGAYIFGANASGKSNFVKAIKMAETIAVGGLDSVSLDKKNFRIDPSYRNKPGVFQFDIFSNGRFYSYGLALSYNQNSILEEWLYQIGDEEKCIFWRKFDEDKNEFSVESDLEENDETGRFLIYREDFRSQKMNRKTFLSDVYYRSPDEDSFYQPFRDMMQWFEHLCIIFPYSKYGGITQLVDDTNEKTRLETLLQYFDTGILSISKNTVDLEKDTNIPQNVIEVIKSKLIKPMSLNSDLRGVVQSQEARYEFQEENGTIRGYELLSDHGNPDDLFRYSDESDGTQRLFDLIPIYQTALQNAVILVDEIDRSLHTKAVQEFIKYYYELTANNFSQLIVTTHDSNILDLDLVRQDEIWFVERLSDKSSNLYSLNRYNARFDKKIEKDYLIGRYGAIPVFRQIERFRKVSISEEDEDLC